MPSDPVISGTMAPIQYYSDLSDGFMTLRLVDVNDLSTTLVYANYLPDADYFYLPNFLQPSNHYMFVLSGRASNSCPCANEGDDATHFFEMQTSSFIVYPPSAQSNLVISLSLSGCSTAQNGLSQSITSASNCQFTMTFSLPNCTSDLDINQVSSVDVLLTSTDPTFAEYLNPVVVAQDAAIKNMQITILATSFFPSQSGPFQLVVYNHQTGDSAATGVAVLLDSFPVTYSYQDLSDSHPLNLNFTSVPVTSYSPGDVIDLEWTSKSTGAVTVFHVINDF